MISSTLIDLAPDHADDHSPRDPGRATDADPARASGIDDTAASRASDLHHALPRAVDGGDSRPDIVGAHRCASTSAQALPLLLPLHSDRGR
jgi:hypothetical protein